MNWEMTEQDFKDIKHLLPESVIALITVVGIEHTLNLVRNWGGTNFPISNRRRNSKASLALHAALAEEVGEKAACKIEEAFNGQPYLLIPRCLGAMRELRNRFIRRQYDEMTSRKVGGMSDTLAIRNLCRAHSLATRQVRYILKETDNIPEEKTVQQSLFAA